MGQYIRNTFGMLFIVIGFVSVVSGPSAKVFSQLGGYPSKIVSVDFVVHLGERKGHGGVQTGLAVERAAGFGLKLVLVRAHWRVTREQDFWELST